MNAVLEREIEKITAEKENGVPARKVSEAEELHSKNMHENYNILMSGAAVAEQASVATIEREEPVVAPRVQNMTPAVEAPSAAERIADYVPVAPAPARRTLFDGITYKNGELFETKPAAQATAAVVEAPAQAPVFTPSSAEEETDDALPTRRTMDTLLTAPTQKTQKAQEEKIHLSAALSAKTKVILAAIALAVVVAIAIICINTSVLNSLDTQISALQQTSTELQIRASELNESIMQTTSQEHIFSWAELMGMIRAIP